MKMPKAAAKRRRLEACETEEQREALKAEFEASHATWGRAKKKAAKAVRSSGSTPLAVTKQPPKSPFESKHFCTGAGVERASEAPTPVPACRRSHVVDVIQPHTGKKQGPRVNLRETSKVDTWQLIPIDENYFMERSGEREIQEVLAGTGFRLASSSFSSAAEDCDDFVELVPLSRLSARSAREPAAHRHFNSILKSSLAKILDSCPSDSATKKQFDANIVQWMLDTFTANSPLVAATSKSTYSLDMNVVIRRPGNYSLLVHCILCSGRIKFDNGAAKLVPCPRSHVFNLGNQLQGGGIFAHQCGRKFMEGKFREAIKCKVRAAPMKYHSDPISLLGDEILVPLYDQLCGRNLRFQCVPCDKATQTAMGQHHGKQVVDLLGIAQLA